MLFCQNAPFSTTQANTEVLFLLQCMNVEIPCFWEICCATTVNTILCMYKKDAHTFAKKDVEGEIPCTTQLLLKVKNK